jgi:DNA processing protein
MVGGRGGRLIGDEWRARRPAPLGTNGGRGGSPHRRGDYNTAVGHFDKRTQALYLLSVARNFEPVHHDALITQLGSLEALLDAPEGELKRVELSGSRMQRLLEARRGCDPLRELERLEARGITFTGWGGECYPELLAQIPDPPLGLFCRGDVQQMRHHGLAVVGSRKCTERGREHATQFGRELAELAVPVVSGMALGIDGAAHEGALEAPGPTVAVLGCGVDVVYPPQHHELYERLCERGLVLSEYPPGVGPLAEHFPQRNRIISGLSRGVLVVEAPLGSGALITARLAAEHGREAFALPGPLRSPHYAGNHHLIKRGQAKLVESVDDIFVEFGTNRAALRKERFATALLPLEEAPGGGGEDVAGSESSAAGAMGAAYAAPGPRPATSLSAAPEGVSAEERRVLEALSYEGTHVNDLVRKLGFTTAQCIAHLTLLEIKGLITSASGGYYVRL